MAGSNGPARVRAANHNSWTKKCRTVFLEALTLSANVSYAAAKAHKSRAGAYRLRARDAEFRAAWDAAIDQSMDELFALLLDRAKHGSPRTITEKGEEVRTVHSYSDAVGLALLRLYRPALHSRVSEVSADGAERGPDLYERIAERLGWPTRPPS